MPRAFDPSILASIDRLFTTGTLIGLTEAELLEKFAFEGDEAAFEALFRRFGPMVLGVCRRLLHDPQDIDDAFQATFLVFVRRAKSIRNPDRLGNWLYGVAHKVSAKARKRATRRAARERSEHAEPMIEPSDALERREALTALHEEIAKLPAKYREPIVLCHLEGHTHEEAARRLGWPVGTVRGRLARGRDRLGDRLSRRGLAGLAPILPTLLTKAEAKAVVPHLLFHRTLRASLQWAAGQGVAAGLAPVSAVALASGVTQAMMFSPLKIGFAVVTVAGIGMATGVGALAPREGANPNPNAAELLAQQNEEPNAAENERVKEDELNHDPVVFTDPSTRVVDIPISNIDELRSQVEIMKARLEAKRAELLAAEGALKKAQAQMAQSERLKGIQSEEEYQEAQAEVAIREAERHRKAAEVREAKIRLEQAMQQFQRLKDQFQELQAELDAAEQRYSQIRKLANDGIEPEIKAIEALNNVKALRAKLGQVQATRQQAGTRAEGKQAPKVIQDRNVENPEASMITVSGSLEYRLQSIERKLDLIMEALDIPNPDQVPDHQ